MFTLVTSADVTPAEFSDWYMLNTWLQKKTKQTIHLHIPISFAELQQKIEEESADIIFVNPYDTAMLVRDNHYIPIVRPDKLMDEVVVVTSKDSDMDDFTQLQTGCRIALTDDKNVRMLGLMLIEPADLSADNLHFVSAISPVAVAQKVIKGKADLGFILTKAYDRFSDLLKRDLKTLIFSKINLFNHTIIAKEQVLEVLPQLPFLLAKMHTDPRGQAILNHLHIGRWHLVELEQVESMMDVIETLR